MQFNSLEIAHRTRHLLLATLFAALGRGLGLEESAGLVISLHGVDNGLRCVKIRWLSEGAKARLGGFAEANWGVLQEAVFSHEVRAIVASHTNAVHL